MFLTPNSWCASTEAEPRALVAASLPEAECHEERGRGSSYDQKLQVLNLPSSLIHQPICPGIWGQMLNHLWDAGMRWQNTVWKQSLTSCQLVPDGCLRITPVVKIPRPHTRGMTMDSTALEDNKAEFLAASQKLIADTDRLRRSTNNRRNCLIFCWIIRIPQGTIKS